MSNSITSRYKHKPAQGSAHQVHTQTCTRLGPPGTYPDLHKARPTRYIPRPAQGSAHQVHTQTCTRLSPPGTYPGLHKAQPTRYIPRPAHGLAHQVQTYTNLHMAWPTRYKHTQTCTRLSPPGTNLHKPAHGSAHQVQTYTNLHTARPTRYKHTQTCTRLGPPGTNIHKPAHGSAHQVQTYANLHKAWPTRYKHTQTCPGLSPPAKIHVRHSNASCVNQGWVCGQKGKMCKTKQKTPPLQSRQGMKMTVHCKKLHNVLRKLTENVKLKWGVGWWGLKIRGWKGVSIWGSSDRMDWFHFFFFFVPV